MPCISKAKDPMATVSFFDEVRCGHCDEVYNARSIYSHWLSCEQCMRDTEGIEGHPSFEEMIAQKNQRYKRNVKHGATDKGKEGQKMIDLEKNFKEDNAPPNLEMTKDEAEEKVRFWFDVSDEGNPLFVHHGGQQNELSIAVFTP
mmetsp:Transcript_4389/g.12269  ORF Transcript_4389/g.12269 Transcript_4389/m.12269 type:complete len:145 (-) Transcript_4389:77-511(-)